jgi:hypothetical protein
VSEVLPPRRVRRNSGPLLIGAMVAAVVLLPVLVVLAVVISVFLPGRWRALRLLCIALVYLALEVVSLLAAAVLWALSGFGHRLDTPRSAGRVERNEDEAVRAAAAVAALRRGGAHRPTSMTRRASICGRLPTSGRPPGAGSTGGHRRVRAPAGLRTPAVRR